MQLQNTLGMSSVSKKGPSITKQIIIEASYSDDDDDSDRDENDIKDKSGVIERKQDLATYDFKNFQSKFDTSKLNVPNQGPAQKKGGFASSMGFAK